MINKWAQLQFTVHINTGKVHGAVTVQQGGLLKSQWPSGKASSKEWHLWNNGWSMNSSFLGKKGEGRKSFHTLSCLLLPAASGSNYDWLPCHRLEKQVWRSLSNFSKFPQLAGERARISTHLNPKPMLLITRLYCLAPNKNTDDYRHPSVSRGIGFRILLPPPPTYQNPRMLKSLI